MRSISFRLRRAVVAVGMLALAAMPPLLSAMPSASATVSTTACPFHLSGVKTEMGPGTVVFAVDLFPNDPARHCVAQVTTTVAITPTQPGVSVYRSIDLNPLTFTTNYAFSSNVDNPVVGVAWKGFCADPPVPGVATLTFNGRPVSTPVNPPACGARGPSVLVGGVPIPSQTVGITASPDGRGYTTIDPFGSLTARGDATSLPSLSVTLNAPLVGIQGTPSGKGAWLVGADGGVFTLGDAGFFGSAGSLPLVQPVVGMAATPDGKGYWLVAADGGVFTYGDAGFFGSTGGIRLNSPIVGMAATHDGKGYWLVAADGGVFAFGDAAFGGSLGSLVLNAPIVGMAAHPGGGYWLVAADGGVFGFGGAPFKGSAGNLAINAPIVGMAATPDGNGYWLVASDGGIFTYGDAAFHGPGETFAS